jgi:hypothetical protein
VAEPLGGRESGRIDDLDEFIVQRIEDAVTIRIAARR